MANITHYISPSLTAKVTNSDDGCVRLSGPEGPFFWYRVEQGWYGCDYIRRPAHFDVIPKIRSRDIQDYRRFQEARTSSDSSATDTDEPLFFQFWARRFAEALSTSTASPLTEGLWQLKSGEYCYKSALSIVKQPFSTGYASFEGAFPAFTIRPMSHPDSGRGGANKPVKVGALPPVLVWWCSGLDCDTLSWMVTIDSWRLPWNEPTCLYSD